MLILFKSWQSVYDLKLVDESWTEAFEKFERETLQHVWDMWKNMQLLHECKDNGVDQFRNRAHL